MPAADLVPATPGKPVRLGYATGYSPWIPAGVTFLPNLLFVPVVIAGCLKHDLDQIIGVGIIAGLVLIFSVVAYLYNARPAITLDADGIHLHHRRTPIRWQDVTRVGVLIVQVADTREQLEARPDLRSTHVILGLTPADRRRQAKRFVLGPGLVYVYGYELTGQSSGPVTAATRATADAAAAGLARFAPDRTDGVTALGPIPKADLHGTLR
ncbi:MAG: hypothetical protein LBR33_03530 [Propionibacteriaceae bacterium]|jgi:hypothetical protein|nr:hypothetical protein [Propionibacteriaceae bacterium]